MKIKTNNVILQDSASIQKKIFSIRGEQVMLDRDLADLYQVQTKRLNEQVRRNIERFPDSFRFQLNDEETLQLVANCDRFKTLKHSATNPYAFTEGGVAMLSAVLKSPFAIKASIQIINAFVLMRKFILTNANLFMRIENIEQKQIETDQKIDKVISAMQEKDIEPKQGIFFDGQIFDAYKFVSELIRKAGSSIILIDNYIDESVLDILTKKKKHVRVTILTKKITNSLLLDETKFNLQYPYLKIQLFNKSHDRFLIIDEKDIYHFGASLKDLGKKWFAFQKLESSLFLLPDMLKKENVWGD